MSATHTKDPAGPRERLLDAADRLFYEQGYAATGINELLAQAGVARASFYTHFPSKDDLIRAYLARRGERWFEDLRGTVESHPTPRGRIEGLFAYLGSWMEASQYRGCAFLNSIPEFPDPASAPRQAVRDAKHALRTYVAELCREAGAPERADEVFLLFEGATAQAAATGEPWPIEAARTAALSVIPEGA